MTSSEPQHNCTVRVDSDDDGLVTITVEGDVDSFSAGQLRECFAAILGRAATVIDMRDVPFLDSSGLGALVGGIRRLRESGGSVAICCDRPSVLRLLAMTGVDRIVDLAESPEQARALVLEAFEHA
jgi:anti-sigma B factor antagonist